MKLGNSRTGPECEIQPTGLAAGIPPQSSPSLADLMRSTQSSREETGVGNVMVAAASVPAGYEPTRQNRGESEKEAIQAYSRRSQDATGAHRHQDYTDCPRCQGPALKDTIAVYGVCSKCRGPVPRPPRPSARLRKEILEGQFAWLKLLKRKFPSQRILVQHKLKGKRHEWQSKSCCANHRVFHRVILAFEVVFDIDVQPWESTAKALCGALGRLAVPFILSWSGGKGPHIHVFLSTDGLHLGLDEWRWVRRIFATKVLSEAGLEETAIDWRPVSSRNYAIKEFGCFRANGRVKTFALNTEDLKAIAASADPNLRFPVEIRTVRYFVPKEGREKERIRYDSRRHRSVDNVVVSSFEPIQRADASPGEAVEQMQERSLSPTSDPISMVLSDKESIDFDKLLAGTREAIERCRPRFQSDDVPYFHMFREGKADKWLATVIAPEVNHLARGNLAGYLFKEVREATNGRALDWFEETVRVLGTWQKLAKQERWTGEFPYKQPNRAFTGALGWSDYDAVITRAQAYSWLKSKGLIRHSMDTWGAPGVGTGKSGG